MAIHKVGDSVKFVLDGRWPGEGTMVLQVDSTQPYVVKLAAPCKEFKTGTEIFVFEDEIINPEKQ